MTLTPTEIESLRIAIAEECGWTKIAKNQREELTGTNVAWMRIAHRGEYLESFAAIPPYTTSLDAIQAAAMERFKEYKDRCLFDWHMANLSSINISYWQLTAIDWCIAFARTAKIWNYKPLNETNPPRV